MKSPPSCISGYCMSISFMLLITATEYERDVEEKKVSRTSTKVQRDESPFQYACDPHPPAPDFSDLFQ
jgi:hypothetical protein